MPVGTPAPGPTAETLVVIETGWPYTVGLIDELIVAALPSRFTPWMNAGEVADRNVLSPEYCAVIVRPPTVRACVVNEAWPVASTAAVASRVAPSKKSTLPV